MKKLICAKDVEELNKQGKKVFPIDCKTIITPSAKDAAKLYGIKFSDNPACCEETLVGSACEKISEVAANCGTGIDSNMIFNVLKTLVDQGMLKGLLENVPSLPYNYEKGPNGLKVVRGNTVKMDYFDTGIPSNKVYYQELISKEDASMSAGFLTIEESKFDWELCYEEIDYVIEGTLTLTIDGKTYTAYPGDVLFVPSGSKVVWGSPDKAKLFYVTYPANWADLMQG